MFPVLMIECLHFSPNFASDMNRTAIPSCFHLLIQMFHRRRRPKLRSKIRRGPMNSPWILREVQLESFAPTKIANMNSQSIFKCASPVSPKLYPLHHFIFYTMIPNSMSKCANQTIPNGFSSQVNRYVLDFGYN